MFDRERIQRLEETLIQCRIDGAYIIHVDGGRELNLDALPPPSER